MKTKSRNPILAKAINKLFRLYWFIIRPKTKGVKALILSGGKVLMVRLTYYPKTWTFPGGGANKDEDPKLAVIRECEEEVGIKLSDPKFIRTLDFNHEYKKDTVYIYKEEISNTNFKIDKKEIAEASWFDLKKLPSDMGKNALKIIEVLK
jgi:8-oxo-dGTP pyrophosphatase MutT (NUDIX family)